MSSPEAPSRFRRTLEQVLGFDLRSLAVLRIGLGVALLYDITMRAIDQVPLYTNFGVLPNDLALERWGRGVYASPWFHLADSPVAISLLFGAFALAAVALLLGWRTRVVTIACWFLLATLQIRNPLAASLGGDKFLRIVLFWCMFLPLGERFSLDARRAGAARTRHADQYTGIPAAALMFQICVMYWMTGILKNGPAWLNGSALYYALNVDYWVTPLGVWLRDYEAVLPFLTHLTRWFEILAPFLLFVPFWFGPVRTLTIVIFLGFHLSLALFMDAGPFPLYCIVVWPIFLPGWAWDVLLPKWIPGVLRWAKSAPDGAPRRKTPGLVQAGVAVAMAYVAFVSVTQLGLLRFAGIKVVPPPIAAFGSVLRLNQQWIMFAPEPWRKDTWPVFHGRLAGGGSVDPLRRSPVLTQKPPHLADSMPSFRWHLYFGYLTRAWPADPEVGKLLDGVASYLCRSWNLEHSGADHLEWVRIDYWIEETDYRHLPPDVETVWERPCSLE